MIKDEHSKKLLTIMSQLMSAEISEPLGECYEFLEKKHNENDAGMQKILAFADKYPGEMDDFFKKELLSLLKEDL